MSEARIGQRRGSGTRVGREADCKDGPKCGGDPIGRSRDAGILGNGAEASLKAMRWSRDAGILGNGAEASLKAMRSGQAGHGLRPVRGSGRDVATPGSVAQMGQ